MRGCSGDGMGLRMDSRAISLAVKQAEHKRILRAKAKHATRYEPYVDPSRSKYPAGHVHNKARECARRLRQMRSAA